MAEKQVVSNMMIAFFEEMGIPLPQRRLKVLVSVMDKLIASLKLSKKEPPLSMEEMGLLVWLLHYRLESYTESVGHPRFMAHQLLILRNAVNKEEEEHAPKGATLH